MQFIQSVLLLVGVVGVSGHGYLTGPGVARAGIDPASGLLSRKLAPYSTAVATANAGCGGDANNEKPAGAYGRVTYAPGADVRVSWKVTLPHAQPANMVRVSVHYANGDSFAQNVLYQKSVAAAVAPQITNTVEHAKMFKLPAGKTTEVGVIQWLWSSEKDGAGGFYIGCSDIRVQAGYVATPPPSGAIVDPTGIPKDPPTGTVKPGGGTVAPGGGATVGGGVTTQRPRVTSPPGGIGTNGNVSPASTSVASPFVLVLSAVCAAFGLLSL